jgi:serine/threonine-protein phosphatase 2A regulatory subunit B
MEIEEKINQIRWCRRINGDNRLLATNDKTIKVWRISEKEVTEVTSLASPVMSSGSSRGSSPRNSPWGQFPLSLPVVERRGSVIQATPRRVFSNAHAYHINSISLNSDEETFLSSDDLRVNMWNLNVGGNGFNILDIKPENMEELTEVITAAEFHPQHCHIFMHSSSRGMTKLCDLRQSALCQTWAKEYDAQVSASASRNSFFSEIIASISDVVFSPDGRYLLTRDYMNLRLWDLNMERAPVLCVPVHDHLRNRLCDLYENDCIFDKFQCAFSHDGGSLLTGSYNSLFQSYSAADGEGAAEPQPGQLWHGAGERTHRPDEAYPAARRIAKVANCRRRRGACSVFIFWRLARRSSCCCGVGWGSRLGLRKAKSRGVGRGTDFVHISLTLGEDSLPEEEPANHEPVAGGD